MVAGKSYYRGRLSTVDLLVITSLDELLLDLTILLTFFTKKATLMRRSTVLSLPPQLVFPFGSHTAMSTAFLLSRTVEQRFIYSNLLLGVGQMAFGKNIIRSNVLAPKDETATGEEK